MRFNHQFNQDLSHLRNKLLQKEEPFGKVVTEI